MVRRIGFALFATTGLFGALSAGAGAQTDPVTDPPSAPDTAPEAPPSIPGIGGDGDVEVPTDGVDGSVDAEAPVVDYSVPLEGFTGGPTLTGANPIATVAAGFSERPVVLRTATAITDLVDAAALAETDLLRALDLARITIDEHRSARAAKQAHDRAMALAAERLQQARADALVADRRLSTLATAYMVRETVPMDLTDEVTEPGAHLAAARRSTITRTAVEEALARHSEAADAVESALAAYDALAAQRGAINTALSEARAASAASADGAVSARRQATAAQDRVERARAVVNDDAVRAVSPRALFATFPVAGEWRFRDDWGDPRSGGRRHKGTDVFTTAGAPVVAIEDGVVRPDADPLGGTVVFLTGDSGRVYYYAHLQAVHPDVLRAGSLRVRAGQVVGWAGDTGNAVGGEPHLHIQISAAGYEWKNPYPLLAGLANGVTAAQEQGAGPTLDASTLARLRSDVVLALVRGGTPIDVDAEASLPPELADLLREEGLLGLP